jgi:hypothetical protein
MMPRRGENNENSDNFDRGGGGMKSMTITIQGAKRDLERVLMRLLKDRTIRVIYVKEEGGDRREGGATS